MKRFKTIFFVLTVIILISFSNSAMAQDGLSIKAKTGIVITYKVDKYQRKSIIIQHKFYESIIGDINVDLGQWVDPINQLSPLYWGNGTQVNVTLKTGDIFKDQICNITTIGNTQKAFSRTIYKGETTKCYDSTSQNIVPIENNSSYYNELVNKYSSYDQLDGNEFSISTQSIFNFSNIVLNLFLNKTFDIKTGVYTQQHAMAIFPNGTILSDVQITQINISYPGFKFNSPIENLIFVIIGTFILNRRKNTFKSN